MGWGVEAAGESNHCFSVTGGAGWDTLTSQTCSFALTAFPSSLLLDPYHSFSTACHSETAYELHAVSAE